MGVGKEQQAARRASKGAKTPRPPSKYAEATANGTEGRASWETIDTTLLVDTIIAVVEDGAAIMFAATSDGGALTALVMAGDDRIRKSTANAEEMETWLTKMLDAARA